MTVESQLCPLPTLSSFSHEVIEYPRHMEGLKNGVWMMRCYSSGRNIQVNGKVVKKVVETTPTLKVTVLCFSISIPSLTLVHHGFGLMR